MHIRLRVLIVNLLLLLILLLQISRPAYAQDNNDNQQPPPSLPDQVRSFINSAGKAVFFLSWPTATYRDVSIGFPTFARDGFEVPLVFSGTGINKYGGSDLHVNLVFCFGYDWKLKDIHWGADNGFVPARFTNEFLAAATVKLITDFANSNPSASGAGNTVARNTARSAPATPPAPIRPPVPINSFPVIPTPRNQTGPGITTGAELLWALDNSLYIPDGDPNAKQIYVIASPCDYYSRQFYAATRPFTSQVQIRWIEMVMPPEKECRSFLGMLARSDSGLLPLAYDTGFQPGPVPPVLQENALRWSTGVENAVSPILRYMLSRYDGPLQYPTLLWVSSRGIEASMRPDDVPSALPKIIASILERPDALSPDPMSRKLMSAQYEFKPADKRAGAKVNGVRLYSMPDERSQVASTLPKDFGYPIHAKAKVNGQTWLELQLAPDPLLPNLYVKEAEVIKVK
jgi:hypothetical protein